MDLHKWRVEVEQLGTSLNNTQQERFALYYRTLIEWNEKMNLTAITEESEVYWKHFYDSLTLLSSSHFQRSGELLDVGAGAGFPGIPLMITEPEIHVTVLDSLQKRIGFLQELTQLLDLRDFRGLHGRAEDYGQDVKYRESYPQVTARAVARLNVLAELCLPFVEVGGIFFAMKGPEAEEEIQEAEPAIVKLGGEIIEVQRFELPVVLGQRTIVAVRKIRRTPWEYPRKAGTPAKKPLL